MSPRELHRRARGEGVAWQVGPYVARVRSPLPDLVDHLQFFYGFHPLAASNIDDFDVFVASNRATAGRRIHLFLDGNAIYRTLPRWQIPVLFEWALNIGQFHLPHTRLVLHAAVVEFQGKGVLIPGLSGAGKSTLCAALTLSGWRLLSDEVAIVDPTTGNLLPAVRPISLKEGSIDVIRAFGDGSRLGKEIEKTPKGRMALLAPPRSSVERMFEPAVPHLIVLPRYDPQSESCSAQPIRRASAFMHLAGNGFNYHILGELGFRTLTNLVDRVHCYALVYRDLEMAVETMSKLLYASREPAENGSIVL